MGLRLRNNRATLVVASPGSMGIEVSAPKGKQSKHGRRFTRRSKWQAGLKIAAIRQWKVVGV
jgi:hypothetical protein